MVAVPAQYEFPEKFKNNLANCAVYNSGWNCHIRFFDAFFRLDNLERQLQIICHEHFHASIMPLYQAAEAYMPKSKVARELYAQADEIVTDLNSNAWLKILRPKIDKAL